MKSWQGWLHHSCKSHATSANALTGFHCLSVAVWLNGKPIKPGTRKPITGGSIRFLAPQVSWDVNGWVGGWGGRGVMEWGGADIRGVGHQLLAG